MTRDLRGVLLLPPSLLATWILGLLGVLGLLGLSAGLSAQGKGSRQEGKEKVERTEGKDRREVREGQEGGDDGELEGATRTLVEMGPDGVAREVIYNPDGSVVERGLDPHELEALRESRALGNIDGTHMFSPEAVLRPHRLAPGQSGTIFVIVTLAGNIVVLPEARIELSYERRQGPLILGAQRRKPPALGRLKTQFVGKPVYEDTVIFEIPVTVEAGAKFQKVPIQGKVTLGATDGSSGRSLGIYFAKVHGQAHIGPPLPTPIPQRTGKSPKTGDPAAESQPAAVRGEAAEKEQIPGPTKGTLKGTMKGRAEPAQEPLGADGKGPAPEGGEGLDESEEGDAAGLPALWLLGGGVLLALLLLLLLVRRR